MKKIAENVNNAFRRLRRIDYHNQYRLYNTEATIISSNCTGGFLMHWLGMRFNTPFINLALNDKDFILMLEHWDEFLEYPIIEVKDHEKTYPVGESIFGIKLHFVHYRTFDEAMRKFEERKRRINQDNFGVLLSNWRGGLSELKRYDNLPFKHKIILSPYDVDGNKTIVKIEGVKRMIGGLPYLEYKNIFGSRYIDQWDFVDWINCLSK